LTQSELTLLTVTVLLAAALLLAVWAVIRWRRSINRDLKKLLRAVSTDTLVDFVIPDGAGGEIHIDHLLLTPRGLMLLETKDMQGAVFAGDRMDLWSATFRGTRLTFNNPIPVLQERAAAISLLAPGVPIDCRVLFVSDATFPKGHPAVVSTIPALLDEYGSAGSDEPQDFNAHWQAIKSAAHAG